MSQKLLNRWKELSNDFAKKAKDNQPTTLILKEARELMDNAKSLNIKLTRNTLSTACNVLKEAEISIGIHSHKLNREDCKTWDDGSHRHVFILPDGTALLSNESGNHSHETGYQTSDLITESGSHTHKIVLPDGSEIETQQGEGEHDHQLLVFDTCWDGIHTHTLKLQDGTIIESMFGGEYWDYLKNLSKNEQKIPPIEEDKTLAEQLYERKELEHEDECLFNLDKISKFLENNPECFFQKLPEGKKILISKIENLVSSNDQLSDEITLHLSAIKADFVIEAILCNDDSGCKIYLTDLLELDHADKRQEPYSSRFKALSLVYKILEMSAGSTISLIETKNLTNINQVKSLENWIQSSRFRVISQDSKITAEDQLSKVIEMEVEEMPLTPIKKENLTDDLVLALAALGFDFVAKEEKKKSGMDVTIFKSDEDKRIVTGVVLEPMFMDLEADIMTPDEVEKAAHIFMLEHRTIGFRHRTKADAKLVESYIAPVDFELNGQKVKKGTWIISVFVEDLELWAAIKRGEIQGFSVGGYGNRKELN